MSNEEARGARAHIVSAIILIADNERRLRETFKAIAEQSILNDMGTGVGRDEYEQMLRGRAAFGYERQDYARVVGCAVRDQLVEELDNWADAGNVENDNWVWLLLSQVLDLHDSTQAGMLGDHYLPENADEISWPEDDECSHEWVAGIAVVNAQDLQVVVNARDVECERCELVLTQGSKVPDRFIWGE